jgi:C4-dicarboxylate-binding protein DctP
MLVFSLILVPALLIYPGSAISDKLVIKLGLVESANLELAPATQAATVFKHIVESQAGDRVEIKLYPGGQLGWERELIEGLRMGTVDMAITSDGPVGGFFEPILVLSIPYLFRSNALAWKVLDGPFGQELTESLRKATGIRALAISELGYRNFTNNKRPVQTPADMKGLKIRTMENPIHMAIVRALGADPTPISFGELYSALQQGIVDGQENSVGVIAMTKAYEVQKYMTMEGHIYGPTFLWINDKRYQNLGPDLQQIFREAATVAAFTQRCGSKLLEATQLKKMIKAGMQVYSPSKDDMAAFKKTAQPPVTKKVEKMIGREWIDKLLKAIDQAEKELAQGN